MKKSIGVAFLLSAASVVLLGTALAQQPATPPAQSDTSAAPPKHTSAAKGSPAALTTPKEKQSYAIGMQLGESFKNQGVDVDPNLLARGLKDTLSGKTLLTVEEQKATIMELQTSVRKTMQEKMAKAAEENKAEGAKFLDANKSKPGVVTQPSGLQYKILHAGTGPKPTMTDSVACNYRGTLIDGTEFDSSYKRGQAATFPVSGVIRGWTEALQMMPVGSKWQLFVPANLAYGDRAPSAVIGPDRTLVFEVELVSIQEKTPKAPVSPPTPATPPPATPPSH
jgi:FKBP-type peptidyl-prolyl cis-trans isomerase FklB